MELIYADLTYQIRKALFSVYNNLGYGHKEEVYQKALAKELKLLNISFIREKSLKVMYKNEIVGTYRPDFVVEEKIIMELKAVDFMPKSFEIQLVNYLKSTGFILGILVNFGSPKLWIKRLVWTNQRKSELKSV